MQLQWAMGGAIFCAVLGLLIWMESRDPSPTSDELWPDWRMAGQWAAAGALALWLGIRMVLDGGWAGAILVAAGALSWYLCGIHVRKFRRRNDVGTLVSDTSPVTAGAARRPVLVFIELGAVAGALAIAFAITHAGQEWQFGGVAALSFIRAGAAFLSKSPD